VVGRIRERIPHASLNTDIIVGFCGETDEQFMDTYLNVKEVGYDKIHLSKYSERPKTVASRKLPDDVSEAEKDRRWRMIDELQKEILIEKHAPLQGSVQSVLIESRHKGQWRGRNPQNKLVFLDDDRNLLGQTVDVTIGWAGPYSLRGVTADKLDTVKT
jgi:tRNA-2-methylthio-N6-dimethylallyladenosine synthase